MYTNKCAYATVVDTFKNIVKYSVARRQNFILKLEIN
jgi:hypothetical protein